MHVQRWKMVAIESKINNLIEKKNLARLLSIRNRNRKKALCTGYALRIYYTLRAKKNARAASIYAIKLPTPDIRRFIG